MKKSSSQKILDVTDLLQQGYSSRAIESKSGLSKDNIARINKTIDGNKETKKVGRPSKLSPADQRRIANRITSGQLDNGVQATQFINNLISHPVHPQAVRNSLKKSDFKAVIKAKSLSSLLLTGSIDFTLLRSTETTLWRTGRGLPGQMRLRSIDLGLMGINMYGKKRVSHFLTGPLLLLSNLEVEI